MSREQDTTLTLGSLFDGSGGFPLAANLCGIEPVWASEIEPYPIAVTRSRFPRMQHLGDIHGICGSEIEPVDVVTFGSPCFPAGTLVNTDSGFKPIERVGVSDRVLSHTGRYRQVLDARYTGTKSVMRLKALGIDEVEATADHRFYIRRKDQKWCPEERRNKRVFSSPQWVELQNIQRGDYLCIPVVRMEENPLELSHEECWLIGRYIADGYTRSSQRPGRPDGSVYNSVVFCIGKEKQEEFECHLAGHKAGRSGDGNAIKYILTGSRLVRLCEMCGKGAENKYIPPVLLNLNTELLRSVLDGYMSGDGCYTQGRYKATTVSRQLAYSLGAAVAKVYHTPCCLYRIEVPETAVIEGRIVNQKTQYQITFKTESRKQDKAFFEDGCIWVPVNEVCDTGEKKAVYDLTVAEDHSFCVLNIAAHNCQDLSIAGKRAGIHEGARSNLFFEAIRVIREMREETNGKYPTFAIWENVPGAFSSNSGEDFRCVLEALARVKDLKADIPLPDKGKWSGAGAVMGDGWSIAWRVLDAQYWGVPQRRRRIYLVADFAGGRAAKILFERESVRGDFTQSAAQREGTSDDAGGSIAFAMQRVGEYKRSDVVSTQVSCQCKAATDLICWSETARTLRARHDSPPCIDRGGDIICIEGDGNDRAHIERNLSPCMKTIHPNVVAYDCQGNGSGDIVPNLTGDHENRVTDYTFNELYHHRAVLFSVIANALPDRAWKSLKHHDGSMYDGMFIVGIDTPDGQATYHYDKEPYWDMFACRELERAPEWDGHTPAQAIERISRLQLLKHGQWLDGGECSQCHEFDNRDPYGSNYCPSCGARMDGDEYAAD